MTPHRLRRVALQRTRKRSQRDPQDFYHGLLELDDQSHRAVIDQLDLHVSPKAADRHRVPRAPQALGKDS